MRENSSLRIQRIRASGSLITASERRSQAARGNPSFLAGE